MPGAAPRPQSPEDLSISDFHHNDLRRFGQHTSIDVGGLRTCLGDARVEAHHCLAQFRGLVEQVDRLRGVTLPEDTLHAVNEMEKSLESLCETLDRRG